MEAIKLLLGLGSAPTGKLVHYDALSTSFRSFSLRKDPECCLCGDNPTVTDLIDYHAFCGMPSCSLTNAMKEIDVKELKQRLDAGSIKTLIDVRMPHEYEAANLNGKLIPLPEFADHISSLDPNDEIIIHCKAGGRSARACQQLLDAGFTDVTNIAGGIDAWRSMIDPTLPPA